MAMTAAEINDMIKEALPDAEVTIEDLRGDGDHYAALVVSSAFEDKSRVQTAPDGLRRPPRQDGRPASRPGASDSPSRGVLKPGFTCQGRRKAYIPPHAFIQALGLIR